MLIVSLSFSLSFEEGNMFGKMAWAKESWKGDLLSSSLLAWKRENTKRSPGRLEQWRDKKSIQIQLVTTYCNNTWLDTKLFAIIRNKEVGQDQECQHTFAHLPLWAGHDVYPTTESLDDLDASRTGIHHHVMYTTPSHPSMLSHMNWFPCYRFWDFTLSFYISRCIFLHDKSLEYIPPTRGVWPLSHIFKRLFWSRVNLGTWGHNMRNPKIII